MPESPGTSADDRQNPCLFVVGCPRSGTTLLQRMLDHHPQLAVANDSHFIPRVLEKHGRHCAQEVLDKGDLPLSPELVRQTVEYHRFRRLELDASIIERAAAGADTYRQFVGALYTEYGRLRGKPFAGEKTPDYVRRLPLLHALFPWAKMIHIIRDGRDTALSLLQWANEQKGPGRFELWKHEPIAVCALWWRWLVESGRAAGKSLGPSQYCEVQYEQLVAQAGQELTKLADFLQLPYAPEMLEFHRGKRKKQAGLSAKDAWLPATTGLRDWSAQMDSRNVELFEALAGDLLSELGYARATDTISPEIARVADHCRQAWQEAMKPSKERAKSAEIKKPGVNHDALAQLSDADSDIVRRDTALSGLATLLDPEAFRELLASHWPGEQFGPLQLQYVRYKPGKRYLAAYRVEVDGVMTDIHAAAYRSSAWGKIRRAYMRASERDASAPLPHLVQKQEIAIYRFPADPELTVLPRLVDSKQREELLRRLFPEQEESWAGTIETLRYKPQRRYVARLLLDGEPKALLKFYTQEGYLAAQRNAKVLEPCVGLQLAERIGRSDRHQIVALQWLPGQLLSDAITDESLPCDRMAAVGAALAAFHGQDSHKLKRLTANVEALQLLGVAEAVGWLDPQLADRAEKLAGRLAQRIRETPFTPCAIHGDFYAKQVLLTSDGVAVLDLDKAVRGDPAVDLGNFIAWLEFDALQGRLASDRIGPLQDALLDGYQSVDDGPAAGQVALQTAAALFRLATDPFRGRQPDWPQQTSQILQRTEAILAAQGATETSQSAPRTVQPSENLSQVPVTDPFNIAVDPYMRFLPQALDPKEVFALLEDHLPRLTAGDNDFALRGIRVIRYKPQRRCLIQYDLFRHRAGRKPKEVTLVGKVRAKGLEKSSYRTQRLLYRAGFVGDSEDGISVPKPLGTIPELRMWCQQKVRGVTATDLLTGPEGPALAGRIAEAACKLHATQIEVPRRHAMAEELQILHERLPQVASANPAWHARIDHILAACDQLGAATPTSPPVGIHRDFYPDQIIVRRKRLYLLDFDLYCQGPRELDAGNFCGHLIEQGLRTLDGPDALRDCEEAFVQRFLELSPEAIPAAIEAYATLTLVRHIHLSTQLPGRESTTEALLQLCEQRL